jgi:hypothetical protein
LTRPNGKSYIAVEKMSSSAGCHNPDTPKHTARCGRDVWRTVLAAMAFGAAMGLLEAICVIYLRHLLSPSDYPASSLKRFPVEQIREGCTLVMLLTAAWLAGRNAQTRVAYFFLLFGIWDIAYYAGLKWLAHWPASWLDWDCLFLIPIPWYSPVLAPLLVSLYFVAACIICIAREHRGAPVRWRALPLALQMAAPAFWFCSFVNNSTIIEAKGYSGASYSWSLLACGLICGGLSLFLATRPVAAERNGAPASPNQ